MATFGEDETKDKVWAQLTRELYSFKLQKLREAPESDPRKLTRDAAAFGQVILCAAGAIWPEPTEETYQTIMLALGSMQSTLVSAKRGTTSQIIRPNRFRS